jgi:hypothetical protein
MKELISAVVKAQTEFLAVKRDETAQILTKSGAKFSYQYANLETCIEQTKSALHSNGLAVIQILGYREGHTVVITKLLHVSGQMIEGEQILECSDPKDPQKVGSAITYLRRYGYMAILGIAAEDDDGNNASKIPPPTSKEITDKPEAVKAIENKFKNPAVIEGLILKGELHQKTINKKTKKDGTPYTIYEYVITSDGGQTFDTIGSFTNIEAQIGNTMKFSGVAEGIGVNKGKYSAKEVKLIASDDTEDIPFGND